MTYTYDPQKSPEQNQREKVADHFETLAYFGYASYGHSMSDGIYRPISRQAFVAELRSKVPVSPDTFRAGTDFHPIQLECDQYNNVVKLLYSPKEA